MDLSVEILKKLLYDKDKTLKLYVAPNKKAVSSALNFISILIALYPSYNIYLFDEKHILKRNKGIKNLNVVIQTDKSLKFEEQNNQKQYSYVCLYLNLIKQKAKHNEGKNLRNVYKQHKIIAKSKIIEEVPQKFSNFYYCMLDSSPDFFKKEFNLHSNTGIGEVYFQYRNPFILKVNIPFIDKKLQKYAITKRGNLERVFDISSKEKLEISYKISKFFRNPLYTYSLATHVLFLIDIIVGKETLESISKEYDEDIIMLEKRINKAKKNLYGVLEGLLNEASGIGTTSAYIRENFELFKVPKGYESFYLNYVLKSLFYFLNRHDEMSKRIIDFYNEIAKKNGKGVARLEDFLKPKPKLIKQAPR